MDYTKWRLMHDYERVKRICPRCLREKTDKQWYGSPCFKGTCPTIAKQVASRRKRHEWEKKHRRPMSFDWRYASPYDDRRL